MVQLGEKTKVGGPSEAKVKDIQAEADEIEKVFNLERDIANAKIQDPKFGQRVNQIHEDQMNFRKTYRDPDYLRDPISPYESAVRKMNDKKLSEFEATKQVLDNHRTVYGIIQAEALNPEDLALAQ